MSFHKLNSPPIVTFSNNIYYLSQIFKKSMKGLRLWEMSFFCWFGNCRSIFSPPANGTSRKRPLMHSSFFLRSFLPSCACLLLLLEAFLLLPSSSSLPLFSTRWEEIGVADQKKEGGRRKKKGHAPPARTTNARSIPTTRRPQFFTFSEPLRSSLLRTRL